MKITDEQIKLAANTIRCLCADMVDKANSGHPGAPLGMADFAATLWLRFLNTAPADPTWPARDRVVFSGGHASSLVYALFHLAGTNDVTLDELKTFRQFESRCAGHPERDLLSGIDVTTGPLGQGIAMGAGLALAAQHLKRDNRTWVFCGDGDMEEGICHEACCWAGTLKLPNLILVYDSNGITIEGSTAISLQEDTKKRFESYGWRVFNCNGHDIAEIDRVCRRAMRVTDGPVLIISKTTIGCGSPSKQGTPGVHGAPLGADETKALKAGLGFDPEKSFFVPDEVKALFTERFGKLNRAAKAWRRKKPDEKGAWAIPDYKMIADSLPKYEVGTSHATRNVSGEVMNALLPLTQTFIGGSADLAPSNKTYLKGLNDIAAGNFEGRNIHYGIRELAMTAIANGITAYGTLRGFGATFFVFSDYCKPALRLAALMNLPSVFVFSHDSFFVGEDGPTHEPIEQLAMLRAMPGVTTYRPCDANETAFAWFEILLDTKGPSCIMTTRQNVPTLPGVSHEGLSKGAYVLFEKGEQNESTIVFIASGSEVHLAYSAAKTLAEEGRSVRVVSMPSMELFLRQDRAYIESTVPNTLVKRVIVEAGTRFGLDRFVEERRETRFITLDHFGASAPYKKLAEVYGFTEENVLKVARELI